MMCTSIVPRLPRGANENGDDNIVCLRDGGAKEHRPAAITIKMDREGGEGVGNR